MVHWDTNPKAYDMDGILECLSGFSFYETEIVRDGEGLDVVVLSCPRNVGY